MNTPEVPKQTKPSGNGDTELSGTGVEPGKLLSILKVIKEKLEGSSERKDKSATDET